MSNDGSPSDGPQRNPLFEPLPAYSTPPIVNQQIIRSNRRKSGRLYANGVMTSIGELVDLSMGGMRLRCGRSAPPIGTTIACHITSPDVQFEVLTRIVRVQRIGLFSSEVGVQFVNLSEQGKACLSYLAKVFAADGSSIRVSQAA